MLKAATRSPATGENEEQKTANRLFFRLYQASNLMHKTGTSAVSQFGVTTQQWAVLGALSRPQAGEGISVKELMDFLMVSRQSMTAILDRLEDAGLIERARMAGDGRIRTVRLTRKGIATWKKLLPHIYGFYDDALAGLSAQETARLARLLERLTQGLAKLQAPE